jgi:hypothetical protein
MRRGRASPILVQLAHQVLQAIVASETDVELNVLVSTMSAPAARYAAWMSPDDLRARERQQIVVAFLVMRLANRSPRRAHGLGGEQRVVAVRESARRGNRLRQFVLLDHRAHRAVDHQDALRERRFQRRDACGVFPGQVFGSVTV